MKRFKKNISLLFVAVLIISSLGGCIKYSDGKPVETTEAANIKETPKPSENKEKEEKSDEGETKKDSKDEQATVDLQTYLDENFFMTSWYELIEEVTVSQNKVTVKTSVFGDDEGKEAVEGLVSSIWRFTNGNDSVYDFTQITILDKEKHAIISEENPLQ